MRQPDNTTFSQALIYSQFAFTGTASAVCIEADQQNWQELLHTLHRIDWCNRPAIDAALLLLPKEAKHRISLTRPRKISSSKQKQRIPIIPEAGDGRTDHQDGVLCCSVSYRLQASRRQATGKAIPWHCTTQHGLHALRSLARRRFQSPTPNHARRACCRSTLRPFSLKIPRNHDCCLRTRQYGFRNKKTIYIHSENHNFWTNGYIWHPNLLITAFCSKSDMRIQPVNCWKHNLPPPLHTLIRMLSGDLGGM
jgi:hypothetical protein